MDTPNSQSKTALAHYQHWLTPVVKQMQALPYSGLALVARFSIAGVFWQSGQTKVQGFVMNFVTGDFQLGWPRLADGVIDLFETEYKLPLLPPALGAIFAAFGEHAFPLLILLGLATRFSALALLGMTAVIQLLVYPGAYPTHGVWASVLLLLMMQGPGKLSLDHWIASKHAEGTKSVA
jgi:putative oxidoreductase